MTDFRLPKPKRHWYQFGLRTLLVVTLVLGVLFGLVRAIYLASVYPMIRHRRVRDEMEMAILRLSVNRPPDLTEDQ